jgi:hypothetical protein
MVAEDRNELHVDQRGMWMAAQALAGRKRRAHLRVAMPELLETTPRGRPPAPIEDDEA